MGHINPKASPKVIQHLPDSNSVHEGLAGSNNAGSDSGVGMNMNKQQVILFNKIKNWLKSYNLKTYVKVKI